jgi:hypothetical protein
MKPTLLAALAIVTVSAVKGDIILSLAPSSQTVAVGAPLTVNLNVSGLGSGTALGTYDLNLSFDSTLLSYTGTVFGSQLDLFGLGGIQFATLGSGTLNLFELSLDSVDDLNILQARQFTLATITFSTLAVGSLSPLTISLNALGDASGNSIAATLQNGTFSVSTPSAIPEPGSLALLIAGVGLVAFKRARGRCSRRRE